MFPDVARSWGGARRPGPATLPSGNPAAPPRDSLTASPPTPAPRSSVSGGNADSPRAQHVLLLLAGPCDPPRSGPTAGKAARAAVRTHHASVGLGARRAPGGWPRVSLSALPMPRLLRESGTTRRDPRGAPRGRACRRRWVTPVSAERPREDSVVGTPVREAGLGPDGGFIKNFIWSKPTLSSEVRRANSSGRLTATPAGAGPAPGVPHRPSGVTLPPCGPCNRSPSQAVTAPLFRLYLRMNHMKC